jgi:hypothetical protein
VIEPHSHDWWLQRAFVYVGRMDPDKGVGTIIAAWRALREYFGDAYPPLWLVGGTPDEVEATRRRIPHPEELARDECAGRIHWWGYLDPAGISTVLLRAVALVMHSRYEPGGRVVLEAMTEGVPVIATPHGFAATLIRDWCTGFLVEFGDEETLRHRLEHFVRQPLLRNSLGAAAREAAADALAAWSFLDAHCDVYEAAIRRADPCRRTAAESRRCLFPRFAPTYPHRESPPPERAVACFIEKVLGTVAEVRLWRDGNRSVLWRVTADSQEWVIKWPAPLLRQRPLWDDDDAQRVWSHQSRWSSEAFAAEFPFHLRLAGQDSNLGLLLFRSIPAAPFDWSDPGSFGRVAALLGRTSALECAESAQLHEAFDQPWTALPDQAFRSAPAGHARVLTESGRPWHPHSRVSLRYEWARRCRDLAAGRLRLPPGWTEEFLPAAQSFATLAEAESALSVRPCHGTVRKRHIRADGQTLWLIDGERIHLAFPGEDLAHLLSEASETAGDIDGEREAYWRAALPHLASGEAERLAVIGWAALGALEGMVRSHMMRRPDRFVWHHGVWQTAVQVSGSQDGRAIR